MALPKSNLERIADGGSEHFDRWLSYLRKTASPQTMATLAMNDAHPGLIKGAFMAGFMAHALAGKR